MTIRERCGRQAYDAIVVGAGPNGLAAAITLAQAGRSVLLLEAQPTPGGGCRSAELTLPGFLSDRCSAIHPLAVSSPFFRTLPLQEHGLEWIYPTSQLAHPLDDGSAVLLERSVEETADDLGSDGPAYRALMRPLVARWGQLEGALLGPPRPPRHPLALARFGALGILPATWLARDIFRGERACALFAGLAAHSLLSLTQPGTSGYGLVLGILGHAAGWPLPRGGAQRLTDALVAHLGSLGGEVLTDAPVRRLDDLPGSRATLFDVTPRQLLAIAGDRLPVRYRRILERYRYGPGVFKVDWALDGPVPWKSEAVIRAGTVHLGGTLAEIAASESSMARGIPSERPFILVAQQSLFDPTRAPEGKQTLWTYCHVPNGSTFDMTDRISAQIERFAPGFGDRVLARHVTTPADLEAYDANCVGGDINGGMADLRQLIGRPALRVVPYATSAGGIYLCSASTPPGGGVHGMCGRYAARAAIADMDGLTGRRRLRAWLA